MKRYMGLAICLILTLLTVSAAAYSIFFKLWEANVGLTVASSMLKKKLQILTRPYLPIAELIINYEWVSKGDGGNVYKISNIQVKLIGFTGYYRLFIRDNNKKTVWSDWRLCGKSLDRIYTSETFAFNVRESYEIGISLKGIDDVTALVKPFLKFTDWYVKAAAKLVEKGFGVFIPIEKIYNLLKPEDVRIWEEAPIAFAKSSVTQFEPESPQTQGTPIIPNLYLARIGSSGELRVHDSKGRVTGLVSGEAKEEIPNSYFFNDTVVILHPSDLYTYEIIGTAHGFYDLIIASITENASSFIAADIPTSPNSVHQYVNVDWNALSLNEEGISVNVDTDADGVFERFFISDNELHKDEFLLGARKFYALWENINYPVFIASNSTISNFGFSQPLMQINFKISSETGTSGYCNVTIPKNLLKGEPWTVKLNGTNWNFQPSENETHSFIYFTYTHASTFHVVIQGTWVIPEFPSTTILTLLMLATLIATILLKRRRKPKTQLA